MHCLALTILLLILNAYYVDAAPLPPTYTCSITYPSPVTTFYVGTAVSFIPVIAGGGIKQPTAYGMTATPNPFPFPGLIFDPVTGGIGGTPSSTVSSTTISISVISGSKTISCSTTITIAVFAATTLASTTTTTTTTATTTLAPIFVGAFSVTCPSDIVFYDVNGAENNGVYSGPTSTVFSASIGQVTPVPKLASWIWTVPSSTPITSLGSVTVSIQYGSLSSSCSFIVYEPLTDAGAIDAVLFSLQLVTSHAIDVNALNAALANKIGFPLPYFTSIEQINRRRTLLASSNQIFNIYIIGLSSYNAQTAIKYISNIVGNGGMQASLSSLGVTSIVMPTVPTQMTVKQASNIVISYSSTSAPNLATPPGAKATSWLSSTVAGILGGCVALVAFYMAAPIIRKALYRNRDMQAQPIQNDEGQVDEDKIEKLFLRYPSSHLASVIQNPNVSSDGGSTGAINLEIAGSPKSEKYLIAVDFSMTVENFKAKLLQEFPNFSNGSNDSFKLVCSGKEMITGKTLSDYGLCPGETVILILKRLAMMNYGSNKHLIIQQSENKSSEKSEPKSETIYSQKDEDETLWQSALKSNSTRNMKNVDATKIDIKTTPLSTKNSTLAVVTKEKEKSEDFKSTMKKRATWHTVAASPSMNATKPNSPVVEKPYSPGKLV